MPLLQQLPFDFRKYYSKYSLIFDDFLSSLGSSSDPYSAYGQNGGGNSTTNMTTGNNTLGVLQQYTGTASNGQILIGTFPNIIILGNGIYWFKVYGKVPTLSDAGDEFSWRFGYSDSYQNFGDFSDGVYFEYDRTQSTYWRYCTSTSDTRTKQNSTITVDTNWRNLEIVVNANASSVEFFIDGVSLGTITTNIPNTSSNAVGIYSQLVKSAGTTSRAIQMDYMFSMTKFTSPR